MGLRGRLAVLSEGYSNADFRTRIAATYNFVREILGLAAEQHTLIKSLVLASDRRRPDSVVVRSVLAPPSPQDVIAEITQPEGEGSGGFARRRRTGVYRTIKMPVFERFVAARKEALPAGYLIPSRLEEVVHLLRRQGIGVERLRGQAKASAQSFPVDTLLVGPVFEGHRTLQAEGHWSAQASDTTIGDGWFLVRTTQPLGVLAAYLLEPASEDGVVAWDLLDRELLPRTAYPILRVSRAPDAATVAVP
jgi:dipeptidyl-peptidase-4